MKQVTLAQFGMGPIGVESVRLAAKMPWARVVGAVDIDPDKIGRSLAELTGVAGLSNVYVHGSFADLWSDVQPAVVLHTAGSNAIQSIEQIMPRVELGVSVASTCSVIEIALLPGSSQLRSSSSTSRRQFINIPAVR